MASQQLLGVEQVAGLKEVVAKQEACPMTIADSFREQADQVEVKHQMPIFPEEEACLVVLEVACWVVPEVAY